MMNAGVGKTTLVRHLCSALELELALAGATVGDGYAGEADADVSQCAVRGFYTEEVRERSLQPQPQEPHEPQVQQQAQQAQSAGWGGASAGGGAALCWGGGRRIGFDVVRLPDRLRAPLSRIRLALFFFFYFFYLLLLSFILLILYECSSYQGSLPNPTTRPGIVSGLEYILHYERWFGLTEPPLPRPDPVHI